MKNTLILRNVLRFLFKHAESQKKIALDLARLELISSSAKEDHIATGLV
jgi:hypothetical protein